jgi:hypothetical protein
MYNRIRVQQRLESSVAGRAAISVFLLFTVFSLVVWNLPSSEIKRRAFKVVRPYITATSLDQNWGVFAPDPRRISIDIQARVRYADGTSETIDVPRGNDVYGAYWDYRWWKWAEWIRQDAQKDLWKPAALWFARKASTDGRKPTRVVLVRRWYDLRPPGPGPSRGPWHEFAFYTLTITGSDQASG